jgi:uncharacterized membrane protein YkoI
VLFLALRGKKSLHLSMQRLFLLLLSLVMSGSLVQANPSESKSGTKITKNEAEHIALKEHTGARVTAARLEKIEGKPVWRVEVSGPKANYVIQVTVDALNGRILSEAKGNR